MASDEDVSFESHFMSAPSSPQRLSVDSTVAFYSVPPSPAHCQDLSTDSNLSPAHGQDPEFEFDTILGAGFISPSDFGSPAHWTRSSNNNRYRGCDSLPAMAFADELFCDGKVMPLKPPPGSRCSIAGSRSPFGASPPRSPRSPFSRRNLWNDDFDPFMAAMESVRVREEAGGINKTHRRARSLLPFLAGGDPNRSEPGSPKHPTDRAESLYSIWEPNKDRSSPIEPKSQAHKKLAGPIGLRIMRFLMRSKSMNSSEVEGKGGFKKKNGNLLRRLSFNGSSNNNKKPPPPPPPSAAASSRAVTKVMALQYRPRLFLCLSRGRRGFRYVK